MLFIDDKRNNTLVASKKFLIKKEDCRCLLLNYDEKA